MSAIDKLAKIDNIATRIIYALRRGVEWVADKYEDCLVYVTYKVVEAKSRAVGKVEDKIAALEDARIALEANFEEAKARLRAKYQLALGVLEEERYAKDDALRADLAEAVQKLVDAGKDYDATVDAALVKLNVKVEA